MRDSLLARLMLPYIRAELPGWGKAYRAITPLIETSASAEPPRWRIIRGKWHGYRMRLNLSDWSERATYFVGRYYDLPLQLLMDDVLEPGDRFVDIGANIGMISLHAASRVGTQGRIDAFEPNPDCIARIEELREMNDLSQLNVHAHALSDEAGEMTLNVITAHTGMGTLAPVDPADQEMVSQHHQVPVRTGDEVLLDESAPIKLIKIDVEGFEHRVLRGLQQTLERWRPYVVTEFVAEHFERAGTTREAIAEFMFARGYLAYELTIGRDRLRHRLALLPMRDPTAAGDCTDILWAHPSGPEASRLRSRIV